MTAEEKRLIAKVNRLEHEISVLENRLKQTEHEVDVYYELYQEYMRLWKECKTNG